MGGREHTQRGRRGRLRLRRAVLRAAFGALAGVLFLCALCVRSAEPAVASDAASHAASDVPAYGVAHARGAGHGAAPARVVCVSPYDLPGCSPLTHVTPGVLPAPAPEVTPAGGEPPPVGGTAAAGPALPPEPLARAPDLHVLQVLRT